MNYSNSFLYDKKHVFIMILLYTLVVLFPRTRACLPLYLHLLKCYDLLSENQLSCPIELLNYLVVGMFFQASFQFW
jgi:hypothetical protein